MVQAESPVTQQVRVPVLVVLNGGLELDAPDREFKILNSGAISVVLRFFLIERPSNLIFEPGKSFTSLAFKVSINSSTDCWLEAKSEGKISPQLLVPDELKTQELNLSVLFFSPPWTFIVQLN